MSQIKPFSRKIILSILLFIIILGFVQTIKNYLMEYNPDEESTETIKKANYCIFIEIEDKILYLLQDGKCIKKYIIASGQPTMPSPLGCWKIVSKGDWGEGFGGRWMGFNVPWGMLILDTCKRGQSSASMILVSSIVSPLVIPDF